MTAAVLLVVLAAIGVADVVYATVAYGAAPVLLFVGALAAAALLLGVLLGWLVYRR